MSYVAEYVIGDNCLLHYRKDTNVKGRVCMFYEQQEKTIFYHSSPYFNVESVS